ncbi:PREDICTED: uncharacterized protein LOC105570907 isoform X3 [Vollenhovia emeryi]|uniref:uncharacterized protein LOC105570907 isoform X3 n=1 Tax=Vollenhovia emeryi TaxID=411798 RepID=UPI0005F44157|nr:PREDICTED: uncharacterized protein LOC105570907 isoform X3 [Vollenhovia emeryi]
MAFYVVLYDTYSITVPTKWIDFARSTFKMPKKCKQLTQACMKERLPCDDWDEFIYQKSFGPYETYQNARSVEKAISDISASDDNIIRQTQTNNTSKKRLIKKRKFFDDTSSDEDEPEKITITVPSNYISPIESGNVSDSLSQPTNKLLISSQSGLNMQKTMTHDDCDEQEKKTSKEMPQVVKSLQKKAKPIILSDVTIGPSTSNFIVKMHSTHEASLTENNENNREDLGNESIHTEHTSCCEKCRQGYSSKFVTLERKLNRIIHFLENTKEVQNEVRQVDFSLLPNFPLTTVEQVEAFNSQLEDNNVRRQFIEKMSQVGGETVPKNVRNIMSQIIGYEVAQTYTWTGQKKKLSLRKSKLSDSVIGIYSNFFVLCF